MKSLIPSLAAGAMLALAGCAFHRGDPFLQVQPGMEQAQVEGILGAPVDRKFVADHDEWTYRKEMGRGVAKTKVIVFENKKVVALADDSLSAEREFELSKARASAPQYPGYQNQQNAQNQPGAKPTVPAGSPMVMPPQPGQAQASQPANPSVGTSTGAPQAANAPAPGADASIGQPPSPATDAQKPKAEAKPQAAVPPASDLSTASPTAEKKVVQKKKTTKKSKKHVHRPITEPKAAEEAR